jgi:spermidine synthase
LQETILLFRLALNTIIAFTGELFGLRAMLKINSYNLNMEHLVSLPSIKVDPHREDFTEVDIREHQGIRWIRIPDGTVQSVMLLQEPAFPVLGYIQAMLCSLLLAQHPCKLLNLGLGSGSIERFLLTQLPDITLVSVEIDTRMVEVAKRYFLIPPYHPIIEQSALSYLESNQDQFDILLSDICTRQGAANSEITLDFITHSLRAMNEGGVLAINLMPKSESEVVEVLIILRSVFPWVLVYDAQDAVNMILFCALKPFPASVDLRQRADGLYQATGLDLSSICSQLIKIPVKR